ncbi:hypothetical protein A7P84_08200 [Eikenella corrodens]|uniref:hypothetical protein n=1 Tax=Eikenella corrodens TaxID=539 RepID=UPI0007D0ADE7|nr:hypothetical protein [Eikenella corrodens]OAM16284.1 hypothetical protein A7P84_08200 [Eikenella corrodens]
MKEKLELEVGIRVKVKEQVALSDEDKAEIKKVLFALAIQGCADELPIVSQALQIELMKLNQGERR